MTEQHQEEEEQEFVLLKRRPGCTGMFWRPDPTGKTSLQSGNEWPRDNATLRGTVVVVKGGQKWLRTTHVKQSYETEFVKAPEGAYMPFEYSNYYLKAAKKKGKDETEQPLSNEAKDSKSSAAGVFGWLRRKK